MTLTEELRSIAERKEIRVLERVALVTFVLLMLVDVATTVVAIEHSALVESNALAKWFIVTFGALPGLSIKLLLMLAGVSLLLKVIPSWSRLGLLTAFVGAHAIAVESNIGLLLRYGLL